MTSRYLDESQVEIVTVDYFRELGYEYIHGPVIAPDGEAPERQDYAQVVLTRRLRDALVRIDPDAPGGEGHDRMADKPQKTATGVRR